MSEIGQFEIQRTFKGVVKPWMPYMIRVMLPSVVNIDFHCQMCTRIYQMLDEDAKRFYDHVKIPWVGREDGAHYHVCDCLGELKQPPKRSRLIKFESEVD